MWVMFGNIPLSIVFVLAWLPSEALQSQAKLLEDENRNLMEQKQVMASKMKLVVANAKKQG